jgi:hypothetical protein
LPSRHASGTESRRPAIENEGRPETNAIGWRRRGHREARGRGSIATDSCPSLRRHGGLLYGRKVATDHVPRPALSLFRFTPLRGPDGLGHRTLMT